ncbi:MAG: hypothetical protein HW407_1813 [Bacteroidetes bacterium]|nr:hypothetical protein [Bacteroidota bacterium]
MSPQSTTSTHLQSLLSSPDAPQKLKLSKKPDHLMQQQLERVATKAARLVCRSAMETA